MDKSTIMLKASIWSDEKVQKQIILAIKYRGRPEQCCEEVRELADMIQEKTGLEYEEYT